MNKLTNQSNSTQDTELPPINVRHRYLICRNGEWVSSTDDLGIALPSGYSLMDTIGEDGLGSVAGNKGIRDFLKARKKGLRL